MTTLAFAMMLQLVVSTKAGLVNHVQGVSNVSRMTQVPVNIPIRTALNGYVEVLLTPGSFLRLNENSEAVLESVELDNVQVKIGHGAAVIEAIEINKDYPIHVTTGDLTVEVFQPGIFRFENGTATVIQGKLRTGDGKFAYDKGWQIFFQDNYRARKNIALKLTGLDSYSQQRSEMIARANASMLYTAQNSRSYWDLDYWLYSPAFGGFTFLPRVNYTSPYGYRYYGVGSTIYTGGGYRNSGGSSGSPGGGSSNSGGNTGNTGNSGGGGDTSGGGGGGGGGVVVAAPSGQQSSPGAYIGGKNAPAPATQR